MKAPASRIKREVKKMLSPENLDIIYNMRKNARQKMSEISRDCKIPQSTVYEKIRNHGGIFYKYGGLLNFPVLGYSARVFFVIKVSKTEKEEVRKFLESKYFVNSLWKINNGYDFMFDTVFRVMNDAEQFKETLEEMFKIKDIHMFYIIQDIRTEEFLSEDWHIGLIKKSMREDLLKCRNSEGQTESYQHQSP